MNHGSLFQENFAIASESIDQVFGEHWRYVPMAKGATNDRPTQDPDRPVVDRFVGAYIDGYARAFSAQIKKQGVTPELPGHSSSRPVCNLDQRQLPYPPRTGDKLVRFKTGQVYQVAECRPNGMGRIALDLNLGGKDRC